MKRSLLIAALSTVAAGSALAQSSVTIYGRLNESVERQKEGGDSKTVLANNASRLGFKGVEDLGGGLKAGFTLEHRFNADNGQSTNGTGFWGGAGESSVFIAGNFGQIKAGHYTSEAYFATSDVTDLLNHGTGSSADALYKYLGSDSNKVSYRTPSFSGATVEVGVLAGEGANVTNALGQVQAAKAAYDVAANWSGGALGLGFGFERNAVEDSQFAIRASYDASPFVLTGYVQRFKSQVLDASQTIARVSGQYNIGAAELHLAFGTQNELANGGNVYSPKARQYTVGSNYNLSKRTKVFAYYNRVKPDGDDAASQIAVGIRHNF